MAALRASRISARTTAVLAVFLSLLAIALEITYTVGHFVLATFSQLP